MMCEICGKAVVMSYVRLFDLYLAELCVPCVRLWDEYAFGHGLLKLMDHARTTANTCVMANDLDGALKASDELHDLKREAFQVAKEWVEKERHKQTRENEDAAKR